MSKAKILMVTYKHLIGDLIELVLQRLEYEIQRYVVYSEVSYLEKVVEGVASIEPDLLIVILADYPDPGVEIAGWNLLGTLHAVEVLRKHSDTPVLFVCGGDSADFPPEVWERIARTYPVGLLSMPFHPLDVATTVQSALQLAAIERRHGKTKEDLETRLVKRTEYLLHTSHALIRQAFKRGRAEESATENQLRLQAIFDCSRDGMFIKNDSLEYTMVNPAMAQILNKAVTELIGRTDDELYEKETADHFREVELRVLQGESIEEEYSRRVNGVELTLLDSRVPLRNAYGVLDGLCGISRDVTERRGIVLEKFPIAHEYASLAMRACLKQARVAAGTDSIVLLLGESGSGKDHVSRYIHENSKRANGPFFAINCAAVAPELAESELFGHERGAFTGALRRKRGLLELAEGGTLLLNEIGELSLPLQAKLLTFLDTRKFTRVGAECEIEVNARLIAATNRDLEEEMERGRFRNDLFYRLAVFSVEVPPLRERREDIPVLVRQLLNKLMDKEQQRNIPRLTPEQMKILCDYDWPGNVRELRNVLERALILSGGDSLELDESLVGGESAKTSFWTTGFPPEPSLQEAMDDLWNQCLREAMRLKKNNQKRAAELLGISRFKLIRSLKGKIS